MTFVPMVIDQTPRGERASDIYSRLLEDNIVFIGDFVDDVVSNLVIAQLLFLESKDPERDISIYINSPGGSMTDGLAVYDTMRFVKPDIMTICIGQAASVAALLLAAGTKGKRLALPNSRVVLHQQLMSDLSGQAADIHIQAREILRMRDILNGILMTHTGQTLERVTEDTDRDFILTAGQAKEYGLIDQVIHNRS